MTCYRDTPEYEWISKVYGDRRTERSNVPLMNHIDEGIGVMVDRNASELAIRAYIVHPIFQGDDALAELYEQSAIALDPRVVMRAMEYRRAANAYLCRPQTDSWSLGDIEYHVGQLLPDTVEMLIADKLQNQKDFLLYHYGTHARSAQLDRYFKNWLTLLKWAPSVNSI